MNDPKELSFAEIRAFMLKNNCKVTNHTLVKHFKKYLTNPETQSEARKKFKSYVNILATIKNENNEKYLILRKKYLNVCPSEDSVDRNMGTPTSPAAQSLVSEGESSVFRQPPPYKLPPIVSPMQMKLVPVLQNETRECYRDCVNEFQAAVSKIDPNRAQADVPNNSGDEVPPTVPPRKRSSIERSFSGEGSTDANKENEQTVGNSTVVNHKESASTSSDAVSKDENKISVKEATRKFNRMASEEEAKIVSSATKKKPEKSLSTHDNQLAPEVTLAHPKAKEWIVAAAKCNYQELAKLASESPELVKLQDPTGYTALHWASKHGNQDIVKLIAGSFKADVNVRTNGGYTPLHLSMQFGKVNIFELLCNVYKANRDIPDYSGKKALDYREKLTTISESTYNKIKARKKHQAEKDLGFLRMGSLNVRVKKTTEVFSNFLGVGGGSSNNSSDNHPLATSQQVGMRISAPVSANRASMPIRDKLNSRSKSSYFDKTHKTWGSADNIPIGKGAVMPPPKNSSVKKRRSKRSVADYDAGGYNSMPTTPNESRAPIVGKLSRTNTAKNSLDSDSDSACGFNSNWSASTVPSNSFKQPSQQ